MLGLFSKLFGGEKELKGKVALVNDLEEKFSKLSLEELFSESARLRKEIGGDIKKLDDFLPDAFALVRETAKRTLRQRHFDVQIMGGVALHDGRVTEMRTGEGKTLAATLPVYLNALLGRGVHVVTVNEYLAKRDVVWMGQIYNALGLSVACLVHEGALMYDPKYAGDSTFENNAPDQPMAEGGMVDKERDTTGSFLVQNEYLRPASRREAYEADITYGTNHEFGFDYLRDNLAHNLEDQVQRNRRFFAIIDEVDSILIDEARTPLIISAPDTESSEFYKLFARVVSTLQKDLHYNVDEKLRTVDVTIEGIDSIEKSLKIENIYAPENLKLVHYFQESLKAKELFRRDRDYVVKQNEIIIVDQFTGRLMPGRRYSGGLHQAIEAKENVPIRQESRTYATVSIQNYFRLYEKLAGMTGTAQTSAEEFDKVYGLEVSTIPTNKDPQRVDFPDKVYKTKAAKYRAIAEEIRERNKKGQPVLVGTVSIEKNEELSRELSLAGLDHKALNAKNNEGEGAIIAQAGRRGAITVATNVAGRGVDIILGGNPPKQSEAEEIKTLGGLHVIGTERHESRRIDNQLRGRAGRQGDPGSSQFFLSLEDDLMRIFGGDRIGRLMETLKVPEDVPIEARMISSVISQAQGKVEGMNFDARKHLLDFDDVLNKQRIAIYRKRQQVLEIGTISITKEEVESESLSKEEKNVSVLQIPPGAMPVVLQMLDMLWMNHLSEMEALGDAVRLRAYGQHDPLVEYRREGHIAFRALLVQFDSWLLENEKKILEMQEVHHHRPQNVKIPNHPSHEKVGRNDPCPCGSGKKYKKCHGS
ncbi:MAG: preprotein translocase subunit SecA [Candidatus Harrisonbacteria bacterium CG10_big_fil_rev_8_21_14_0_10_40_38]|uniref:Protein translocase subunit SecA n=1 Tax=Candidatus Harrisonbacteria bacterium CG10_big_fil_rev_8_21_14_0_10_40_38 TaxID=1974583 RepID=A0A2H0UR21_9BACT|nr:MAG: preprotein translocase subunit SecA [Candidatus Harrisonbacteria bacterium CG10_big_fil_rev_8_21_14_0_10_40_38]